MQRCTLDVPGRHSQEREWRWKGMVGALTCVTAVLSLLRHHRALIYSSHLPWCRYRRFGNPISGSTCILHSLHDPSLEAQTVLRVYRLYICDARGVRWSDLGMTQTWPGQLWGRILDARFYNVWASFMTKKLSWGWQMAGHLLTLLTVLQAPVGIRAMHEWEYVPSLWPCQWYIKLRVVGGFSYLSIVSVTAIRHVIELLPTYVTAVSILRICSNYLLVQLVRLWALSSTVSWTNNFILVATLIRQLVSILGVRYQPQGILWATLRTREHRLLRERTGSTFSRQLSTNPKCSHTTMLMEELRSTEPMFPPEVW